MPVIPDTAQSRLLKSEAEADASLAVPALAKIWAYLASCSKLNEFTDGIHRGIEWNQPLTVNGKETGHRALFVSDQELDGFQRGVPPRARPFYAYQCPPTKFLSVRPEDQRTKAYKLPWERSKVFVNAVRRSRGPWRLTAWADSDHLACYQNLTAVWPKDPALAVVLAAVLNGPVANAYVATREEKRVPIETLELIPTPRFAPSQRQAISDLVRDYLAAIEYDRLATAPDFDAADGLLRQIDATVLQAYDLPPRLERELLDFFNGAEREVPFRFKDYFPANFAPCFCLADYLSPEFRQSTAQAFKRRREPPAEVMKSLRAAARIGEDQSP